QCLLLARRLIEAGGRLGCVNWHQDGQFFWDTHQNNFSSLKHRLMPPADQGLFALLEGLSQRGLLAETLVGWVGEFGRSPRVSRGNAGREHHPGATRRCWPGAAYWAARSTAAPTVWRLTRRRTRSPRPT